ncbi:hypothetical protein WG899_10310 [Paucibacter sp. AS339]|uniref:hypothetical protein n=1 Tax=Paucibacter hankyongi TaxID=3133434 RepID=UPI0030A426A2
MVRVVSYIGHASHARFLPAGLSLLAAAALVACGGGSSSDPTPVTPTPIKTTDVTVGVVDGPIQNALVCLDANDNGLCESTELQGKTDADGKVTLKVPDSDVGKHGLVAVIGTDAVDKDNGPVTTAFVMKTPADSSAVISPLTTLVQTHIESTGASTKDAEKAVQQQLNLNVPLLEDFSKKTDADNKLAADVARLVVVAKQNQVNSTNDAKASDGSALGKNEIDVEINKRLLALLPELIAAANDPTVLNAANKDDKAKAILDKAKEISDQSGLSKENVGSVVAIGKTAGAPEEAASAPSAGLSVRWFTFGDPGNYFYRSYHSTAAQNTTDANGKRHFTDFREEKVSEAGVLKSFRQFGISYDGRGDGSWKRNQTYWTGTEWFDCPAEFVNDATPWDKDGKSESLTCKAFKSKNKRVGSDIAGKTMLEVVKQIRAYPLFDSQGKFADWGPNPDTYASQLAAKFPANAKLHFYSGQDIFNPIGYNNTEADALRAYVAELANGVQAKCNSWTGSTDASLKAVATTLDATIAANPGKPCVYTPNKVTHGDKLENWGASTLSIGDLKDTGYSAPTAYYKSGVRRLRLGFGEPGKLNFFSCLARSTDNASMNCEKIGSGEYKIETVGDARVLSISGLPSRAAAITYERMFIERGGKVYFGFQDKLKQTNQIRPNKEAFEALLKALMP